MSYARTGWRLALAAASITLVGLLACGDDDPNGGTGTNRAFAAACQNDDECADAKCHEFGQSGKVCTKACSKPEDCPTGSEGKKCNNQGVCKP